MRILLDESMPKRLKRELKGHEVSTVPEMGWAGKKNGDLLRLAAGRFEVFLTADQNLTFQQNLQKLEIALVVLAAPNRYRSLKLLMPRVLEALQSIKGGEIVRVQS